MAAIGMGLLWGAYWATLTGVSLVKGYNNSPMGLANPVKVAQFNTACYTGGGIFPTGDPGDNGACGGGAGISAAGLQKVIKSTGGTVQGGHGR